MAIDVLSRPDSVPVILGPADEVAEIAGVATDEEGHAHLLMACADGKVQKLALTASASRNFCCARNVLLFSLAPDDQVLSACRMEMNGPCGEREALAQAEIDAVTSFWRRAG